MSFFSRNKTWFEHLFGFKESNRLIRENLQVSPDCDALISKVNKRVFPIGNFSTPSVGSLKSQATSLHQSYSPINDGNIEIEHIPISGVLELHHLYPNATFQAASQFNCLEFCTPDIVPEDGITMYSNDRTQGPACAVAAAAGTLYRNNFVPMPAKNDVQFGQSKYWQLNTLDDLESALQNYENQYWYVRNGYTFTENVEALVQLQTRLRQLTAEIRTQYRDLIKVGIQERVGVTFSSTSYAYEPGVAVEYESDDDLEHYAERIAPELSQITRVNQVYCSALSISYAHRGVEPWEELAKLVLDGVYEATLWYAAIRYMQQNTATTTTASSTNTKTDYGDTLFLTFVGGGVFGNDMQWVAESIGRACAMVHAHTPLPLKVKVCHFRAINPEIRNLINERFAFHKEELRKVNTSQPAVVEECNSDTGIEETET